jgi:hypothetical protein
MMPPSATQSFKGTIFHTWKGNRPCRIYVTGGHVYFIRRFVPIESGAAAVVGSQFGLLGGLAVGIAGAVKAKTSPDFVRDDDPSPPDQLVSKHADNHSIPVTDIVDSRIEPAGSYVSYGKNAGRWHFTRRGDAKDTVVLLESEEDASQAARLLNSVPERSEADVVGVRSPEVAPENSLFSERADVADAVQTLTQLLGDRAPAGWLKVRCEVRAASPGQPGPLEITIANGDIPDERVSAEPAIAQAATRLARKVSPSVRTFPGLVIEMTRLDHGRWQQTARLMR